MYTPSGSISFDCEFTPNTGYSLPDMLSNETPTNFRMTVNKPGILGFIYRLFRSKKGIETYSFVGITNLDDPIEVNGEIEIGGKIKVVPGTLKKEA